MVVAGKRCVGMGVDASGAATAIYVDNAAEAVNSLVVVENKAVLEIHFSPSRDSMPTANPSLSDYETHGLGLVAPAVGLDGVKILMILKTTILKVVVVVEIVALVQIVSVTILDNAAVEVAVMAGGDAEPKAVVRVDMIAIVRLLGGGVKECNGDGGYRRCRECHWPGDAGRQWSVCYGDGAYDDSPSSISTPPIVPFLVE
jgi:hypothetical protein